MKPQPKIADSSLSGVVVLGVSLTHETFEKDGSSRYRFKGIQCAHQDIVRTATSGLIRRTGEKKMLGITLPDFDIDIEFSW